MKHDAEPPTHNMARTMDDPRRGVVQLSKWKIVGAVNDTPGSRRVALEHPNAGQIASAPWQACVEPSRQPLVASASCAQAGGGLGSHRVIGIPKR